MRKYNQEIRNNTYTKKEDFSSLRTTVNQLQKQINKLNNDLTSIKLKLVDINHKLDFLKWALGFLGFSVVLLIIISNALWFLITQ